MHQPGNPHTRKRLTKGSAHHFPENTLFHRIARTVCAAECLPRKELYESWEVARRIHRRMRGGRVVDLACGHGLLGAMTLILDRTHCEVIGVDRRLPLSATRLRPELEAVWPALADRWKLIEGDLQDFDLTADDLVISAHACGPLTDLILDRAVAVGARVAVLPCCHAIRHGDLGGLGGWLSPEVAMDATRAARLRSHGYAVHTQCIPAEITPQNRLLFGHPPSPA